VDDAEGGVAILERVGDDAQGEEVVDLLDGDLLFAQLEVDGVGAFEAALDAGGDGLAGELLLEALLDAVEEIDGGFARSSSSARTLPMPRRWAMGE
jgi:hypothetical protein